MRYLTIENAKTTKGESLGYLTGILYLAPADEAARAGYDVKNACPFASAGCKSACLFTAGRGAFPKIRAARIRKSVELMGGRNWNQRPNAQAAAHLADDIAALIRKAKREKLIPAVRLNGTSDYPVHKWEIMEQFPDVQFYDYTKDIQKFLAFTRGELPKNYHLTFSRSESNALNTQGALEAGGLVAMVFDTVPKKYMGRRVLDGDESDLTFTRGKGILGLKAKGKARKDASNFVIKTDGTKSTLPPARSKESIIACES